MDMVIQIGKLYLIDASTDDTLLNDVIHTIVYVLVKNQEFVYGVSQFGN